MGSRPVSDLSDKEKATNKKKCTDMDIPDLPGMNPLMPGQNISIICCCFFTHLVSLLCERVSKVATLGSSMFSVLCIVEVGKKRVAKTFSE